MIDVTTSLAATLWADNADLAKQALEHRFVRGLANGALPRATFAGYIVQDAFFLDSFARAYALALAYCPDPVGAREFFDLLSGVFEELHLHASYAARWGASLESCAPLPATLAYTTFLLTTAEDRHTGETCAAMTPCMRLYAYLGQSLSGAGAGVDTNPYADWVRTYGAPEFDALAGRLEVLLDRYAQDSARVRAIYRRAMVLELDFFEAAA